MNSALEFHDSTVESAQASDGTLRVRFSKAYVHCSSGVPGVDSGDGFIQTVEISFGEAKVAGSLSDCIGTLWDGSLSVSGASMGLVPIPFSASGSVDARLEFSNGQLLTIKATSISCSALGKASFLEHNPF